MIGDHQDNFMKVLENMTLEKEYTDFYDKIFSIYALLDTMEPLSRKKIGYHTLIEEDELIKLLEYMKNSGYVREKNGMYSTISYKEMKYERMKWKYGDLYNSIWNLLYDLNEEGIINIANGSERETIAEEIYIILKGYVTK